MNNTKYRRSGLAGDCRKNLKYKNMILALIFYYTYISSGIGFGVYQLCLMKHDHSCAALI